MIINKDVEAFYDKKTKVVTVKLKKGRQFINLEAPFIFDTDTLEIRFKAKTLEQIVKKALKNDKRK